MEDDSWVGRADEVLTIRTAAQLLHVEDSKIRSMANQGEIPGRRLGATGHWRFSRRQLMAWLEQNDRATGEL